MGSLCVLACGARGAVVSLLLFLMLLLGLTIKRNMSTKNIITGIILVMPLLLIIIFYKDIVVFVASIFERNGIDSRFISALLEGSLLEDSGRNSIIDAIIRAVKYNPFGYGFFGDRYATVTFGLEKPYYAHNIFYELVCHLGIIVGPIFIIHFLWRLYRTLIYSRKASVSKIILILIPFGLFQLLFSSSYLECVPFFMLLGLIFSGNQISYLHK